MSFTSVLLPEPETPVTTVITPSGNRTVTFAQIVLARAFDRDPLARQRCAVRPMHNRRLARKVAPRERLRSAHDLRRCALGNHLPAQLARARPRSST